MADISCLLRHYPFVGSFSAKVEDAVRTGRYGFKVDDEYQAYTKTLRDKRRLAFKMESAQRIRRSRAVDQRRIPHRLPKSPTMVSEHSGEQIGLRPELQQMHDQLE